MKKLLLYIIALNCVQILNAQSFTDRLTLQIGASANATGNDEPGAVSLAFHPDIKINKSFSIGLRYDINILQFGSRGKYNDGSDFYFLFDSHVRGISSVSLFPTFNTTIAGVPTYFGVGGGYIQRPPILTRIYRFNNSKLSQSYSIPGAQSAYLSLLISTTFDRLNAGIIYSKIKKVEILGAAHTYASVFINYKILSHHSSYDRTRKKNPLNTIPLLMLEGGIQPFSNLGKYSGGINVFVEPKVRVAPKLSIGFRINSKNPMGIGYDEDPIFELIHLNPNFFYYSWRNTKVMEDVYARILTSQYYFKKTKNGWYFINVGFGQYQRRPRKKLQAVDSDLQPYVIHALPHLKRWGSNFGVGIKSGTFRLSLEYNISGKNIPDYMAAQLGVDLNILK